MLISKRFEHYSQIMVPKIIIANWLTYELHKICTYGVYTCFSSTTKEKNRIILSLLDLTQINLNNFLRGMSTILTQVLGRALQCLNRLESLKKKKILRFLHPFLWVSHNNVQSYTDTYQIFFLFLFNIFFFFVIEVKERYTEVDVLCYV